MTVTHLASDHGALQTAYIAAVLIVPTVGWILLIIGFRQRSRSRPQAHLRPEFRAAPRQGAPSGTKLIVIGAVLLALGAIAIVGRLASTGSHPPDKPQSAEFTATVRPVAG
jgi:UDP-N-acetylmuramyl pentapeptide phosphotransferase/UDP-N-acetylglucosamine-1-phosphate transferase